MPSLLRAFRRKARRAACSLAAFAALSVGVHANAQQATLHLAGVDAPGGNDRFIVRYRDGSPPARDASVLRARLGAAAANAGRTTTLQSLRRTANGAEVIRASRKLDRKEAEAVMRQLAADPNVEYVEVDVRLKPALTPNDPDYPQQWGYSGAYGIRANQAWDLSTGTGAVVAVVDSGIAPHSDLAANVLPGYDFISDPWVANDGSGRDADASDPGDWVTSAEIEAQGCDEVPHPSQWHGTHVAGTIAAVTRNAKGVAGVAYGAKIVPVRVLGRCGAYAADVADGIVWASGASVSGVPVNANPAEVINLSLGVGGVACLTTVQRAIDTAVGRGTAVVVAAGNDNVDSSQSLPANCQNVIVVGATTSTGARAYFSNFGAGVDVAAPGVGVRSTYNSGTTTPARPTGTCRAHRWPRRTWPA